jgi:hypothetical protein
MSITATTTYSGLQSSIADWIARGDLGTVIPDFIRLAEIRLKKDLFGTAFEVDASLSTIAASRKVALPVDFVEPIKLELIETPSIRLLSFQTPVSMGYSNTTGRPSAWCINGASIDLDRPADAVYPLNFRYRWKFALTTASATNWLLTNYPNIYLAASLAEAYLYVKSPEGAQLWDQRCASLVDGLNETLAREKAGAVLMADPALLRRGYPAYAAFVNGSF